MSVNDLSLANDIVVQQLRSVFRHFWRPLGAKHEGEVADIKPQSLSASLIESILIPTIQNRINLTSNGWSKNSYKWLFLISITEIFMALSEWMEMFIKFRYKGKTIELSSEQRQHLRISMEENAFNILETIEMMYQKQIIKFDTVYYADNLALGFNFRNKAYKSEGSIKGAMNVRRLCHLHGIDDPNITNWMHCGMVQPCMRYLGFDSIRYGRELWKHDRYCNLTTEQRAEEEELDKWQQFQYYWMTPHPDLFDA
eukprot:111740_1